MIVLDYYDFKIEIQPAAKNRGFIADLSKIQQKYARKRRMVELGVLSDEAGEKIGQEQQSDLAGLYAKHIITGWNGLKYKGKNLSYSQENATKFFSDPENDLLFADLMEQSADQSNFAEEAKESEEKNS